MLGAFFFKLVQQKRFSLALRPIQSKQIFFKYNNYKNHIINNKNDKNKILNLRMAVRHCWWRGVNVLLPVAFLLKRATASGVFTETCHCQ
jgi:hypothetical protein